jgi:hypothetical protein
MAHVIHRGRRYTVKAEFSGEDRADKANEYMRTHPHTAVLCEQDGTVYIAHDRDFGVVVDAVDSGFGEKGWTNMITGKL